MKVHFLAQP